jgi:hypothetical protein
VILAFLLLIVGKPLERALDLRNNHHHKGDGDDEAKQADQPDI